MPLSWWKRPRVYAALAGAAVALWPSVLWAAGNRPNWHPGGPFSPITTPASDETRNISNLFWVTLGLSGAIFLLVCGMLLVAVVRYSAKGPDTPEPRQIHGNRLVEILWTTIPTIILVVAFLATTVAIHNINTPAKGTIITITAQGHQWWWEFHYAGGQAFIPSDIYTANEVHVPTGVTIHFDVTSGDVIHSFWVPEIARQLDANPGQHNPIFVPPLTQTGTFDGMCYEYCGDAHAWMKFRMIVQTQAQFRAWVAHQVKPSVIPTSGLALAGYKIFMRSTCTQCHNIAGTAAGAQVAPNLTHVASRWTIGAGALAMTPANLAAWVKNPYQYKPGVLMPPYPLLTPKDLNALAAYLYSLK